MIVDFGSLLDRYGRIPNGTRTYYLRRSQPPFFYLIAGMSQRADTLQQAHPLAARRTRLLDARRRPLRPVTRAHASSGSVMAACSTAIGTTATILATKAIARMRCSPRRTPAATPRSCTATCAPGRKAAGTSGSRWLADGKTLATIRTTHIVAVDLNSLLYGLERSIAANCRTLKDGPCVRTYTSAADARAAAINRHLWNAAGYLRRLRSRLRHGRDGRTAAMAFPLFVGIATPDRAQATARGAGALVGQGGLRTDAGRHWTAMGRSQWWAPLQWIAITGLERYGENPLARRIAAHWLASVSRNMTPAASCSKSITSYSAARRRWRISAAAGRLWLDQWHYPGADRQGLYAGRVAA